MIDIREYKATDYDSVLALYNDGETFGGQYDDARDTAEKLSTLSDNKPDCLLVAEANGEIVGTVTIFEDGRSAWLYRFAVKAEYEEEASGRLYEKAAQTLRARGHTQVLVYAPAGNEAFLKRYSDIGFTKGNDFTAYWQDI